jgi:hypothetical protein
MPHIRVFPSYVLTAFNINRLLDLLYKVKEKTNLLLSARPFHLCYVIYKKAPEI